MENNVTEPCGITHSSAITIPAAANLPADSSASVAYDCSSFSASSGLTRLAVTVVIGGTGGERVTRAIITQ